MVSSLLHVLIVTPVIFFWIHERRLGLQHEALPARRTSVSRWRGAWIVACSAIVIGVLVTAWGLRHPRPSDVPTGGLRTTVQRVSAGDLQVVLTNANGTFHQGHNAFDIEFHSPGGSLVDVGTVRASGNMAMPGMVMSSGLEVARTGVPGRYEATAEFGMAGYVEDVGGMGRSRRPWVRQL